MLIPKTKRGGFGGPGLGKFKIAPKEDRTCDGVVFDSKLEMKMHAELCKHFPTEHIKRQVRFVLQPSFRGDWDGICRQSISYKADFVLGETVERNGILCPAAGSMVVDAKGMILPSFRTAVRLFEYKHRMPVHAVKTLKQLRVLIEAHKQIQSMDPKILNILTSGKSFWVRGYTSSDGSVADLKVEIIGREGYLDMVRQSKELLPAAAAQVFSSSESEGYSTEDSASAFSKLRESLSKKLETTDEGASVRASRETFSPVTSNIMIVDGNQEHVAVFRVRILEKIAITPAPSSKTPNKRSVTKLKDMIESKLPIDAYRHRLNLYPGKYTGIEG